MDSGGGPDVGGRIREIRTAQGMSLRDLARRSGLSPNTVSLIERGENSPTVSSLHLLATALDTSIADFFRENDRTSAIFVPKNRRLVYRKASITMESLGLGLQKQQLEPFLISLEPSATSERPVTHPGQEFVYCIEGVVEYSVDNQIYKLTHGDSLLFEATRPHVFQNVGRGRVVLIVVFQASEELNLAKESHLNQT